DLTRYGVGARGIDLIERIVNQGAPSVTFPLYDGHGNMTATLSRSGASFTVSNQRSYDVWGGVRSGATSGFPNTRYVANLGHKQDDESDLIYMRARYYEPRTGRFISEDPVGEGWNFYAYVRNNPLAYADPRGESLWGVDELLRQAFSILTDSHRGFGVLPYIEKLRRIKETLLFIARAQATTGEQLIAEAEAELQASSLYGDYAALEARIADLKMSVGTYMIGEGTAARIAAAIVEIMIQMILNGD
ncbi:MAG: RHS repeat-associated core domain-containing protein, partial [Armatimonadota bacterium]